MKILLLFLFVLSCSGCASAVDRHQTLQHQLDMPIDCTVADHQIATLEEERVTGGEKFLNTLASVIPTSALVNLIAGEYRSRWQIANGNFNQQAESRIAIIEETCHRDIAISGNGRNGANLENAISPGPF